MQLESGKFLTGVNYWCSSNAMEMWRKWDASAVDADFASLAANGCSLVRCFTRWDDFQPITMYRTPSGPGGRYKEIRMGDEHLPDTDAGRAGMSETMLGHFEEFCDLAQKHGLKLIVAMLTGQMTFGLFVPHALVGLDLYRDPLALHWEERFVTCLVNRMKHHPAIWAWESGNETNILGGALNRDASWMWTKWIHSAIRLADNSRPVIGISVGGIVWDSQKQGDCWMMEDQGELSDYLTVHPYGMWSNASLEPFTHIRQLMYCVVSNRVMEDIGGKPSFVEETGLWRPIAASKRVLGEASRGMLWNQYANDCRAMLWWCAFDQDMFDMAPYDWREPGPEHGIMTADRKNMPIADTMRDFVSMLGTLPFESLPSVRQDAVCIVSEITQAYGAWILARQAGINLRFQSPQQPLLESDVYLLPSCKARNFLTTRQWEALQAKVRGGATLYLGLEDTFLTHLEDITGVGVVARHGRGGQETIRIGEVSFTLNLPVRYDFELEGAEVLGVDSKGRPQYFVNCYGLGKVYTLSFPLERLCMEQVGMFETDAWKLYRTFLSKELVVSSGNNKLIATEHPFEDGRLACVLVNNSSEAMCEQLELASGWRVVSSHSDLSSARYADGCVELPGTSGILLMLERC